VITNQPTNQPTPWCRVLFEKLVPHWVCIFYSVFGTWSFNTVSKSPLLVHILMQIKLFHIFLSYFLKIHFSLSSHLCLRYYKWGFPPDLVCISVSSGILCMLPYLLGLMTLRRLATCANLEAPQYVVFTSRLSVHPSWGPDIFLSTLFSHTLRLCCSLIVRNHISYPYETTGKWWFWRRVGFTL
jgi:hypothetical protein